MISEVHILLHKGDNSMHLQNRNGHYHVRLRVPSDLLSIFPQAEITKSLKTSDLKTAKTLALPYLQSITQTATLFRSRFISQEQAQIHITNLLDLKSRVSTIVPSQEPQKPAVKVYKLSEVLKVYFTDRGREWSGKSYLENQGVFKLIIALIGDVPILSIDRAMVRKLREQLLKLPPNSCKLFPKSNPRKIALMHHSKTMSIP
jgi:hypothetical protein